MTTALLLIAHGSRRPEANADLEHLAAELRQRGEFALVACAYLELVQPDIDAGGGALAAQGASTVLLVPYFLSAGMHVTEDLEAARQRLEQKHSGVRFRLCAPLGRHPLLAEIVAQRAREAQSAAEEGGP